VSTISHFTHTTQETKPIHAIDQKQLLLDYIKVFIVGFTFTSLIPQCGLIINSFLTTNPHLCLNISKNTLLPTARICPLYPGPLIRGLSVFRRKTEVWSSVMIKANEIHEYLRHNIVPISESHMDTVSLNKEMSCRKDFFVYSTHCIETPYLCSEKFNHSSEETRNSLHGQIEVILDLILHFTYSCIFPNRVHYQGN
jgi:hypothetical protein